MRATRSFTSVATLMLAVVLLALDAADAQQAESPTEAAPRFGGWSPFVDIAISVHAETIEANLSSTLLLDDPVRAGPGETGSGQQTSSVSTLFLRAGGGITSPALDLPGEPRLRLQGGALFSMSDDSSIWSNTENRMYQNPEGPPQTLRDQITTKATGDWGQGWSADVGVQLSLPLDWDVRVTASARYFGREISYEGSIDRSFEDRRSTPTVVIPDVSLQTSSVSATNHYIGPGLAIEAPFVSLGPLWISLFVDGQVLFRMDGGGAVSNAAPVPVTDNLGRTFTATADMTFEPASHVLHAGGGVRLLFH